MNLEYASLEDMQEWARAKMQRAPDFVIGGNENPYLKRWWCIPRNPWSNVYVHQLLRDDDDRAMHDHPAVNTSVVLTGQYMEHTPNGSFLRSAGDVINRPAEALHRLELIDGNPCVSLFIMGPKTREWGFACPNGWVHWRDFVDDVDTGIVGRGCGEP